MLDASTGQSRDQIPTGILHLFTAKKVSISASRSPSLPSKMYVKLSPLNVVWREVGVTLIFHFDITAEILRFFPLIVSL